MHHPTMKLQKEKLVMGLLWEGLNNYFDRNFWGTLYSVGCRGFFFLFVCLGEKLS